MGDEEAVQFRALNFIAGPLSVRAVPEPECLHPVWGDFKRACKDSGLYPALLKATYICNFGFGPYLSGTGQVELKTAGEKLLARCSDAFLSELVELIAWDRGLERVRVPHFGSRLLVPVQYGLKRLGLP